MNVKSLIGMTVFAIEGGKNLGTVERLLFSPEEMCVTGFVITRAGGVMEEPEPQKVLLRENVKAIGQDAITVESESLLDVTADGELPAGTVAFDQIEKERVLTESGDELGVVNSIDFSDTDFRLEYLEVGRGFLSGSSMISVDKVRSVGEDVIVVRDDALDQVTGNAGDDELAEDEPDTTVV
jgi:uncharacterized protein YrrD